MDGAAALFPRAEPEQARHGGRSRQLSPGRELAPAASSGEADVLSRISRPARWSAGASARGRFGSVFRGSSAAASRVSARTARWGGCPATTRRCRPSTGIMSVNGELDGGPLAWDSGGRHGDRASTRHRRALALQSAGAAAGPVRGGGPYDAASRYCIRTSGHCCTGGTPRARATRTPTSAPYDALATATRRSSWPWATTASSPHC